MSKVKNITEVTELVENVVIELTAQQITDLQLEKLSEKEEEETPVKEEEETPVKEEEIKAVKKSNLDKQTELLNKENKSIFDWVKLANVSDKIEDKTLSKVYKNCTKNIYLNNITGMEEIPSFDLFKTKLLVKENYSNWDGYKALAKFNVKNNVATKVKRQNKAEAKK